MPRRKRSTLSPEHTGTRAFAISWRCAAIRLRALDGSIHIIPFSAVTTVTNMTRDYGYAVFDIQAGPQIGLARIAEAVKLALQQHMSQVRISNSNGIPPSPLPEKAPRFALVSPFKGSGLAALAASQGQSLQVPTCEGAILTANARDSYGRLLGGAIAMTFFVYILVNSAMITGLMPVKGVPLPLISYGGTSAVSLLVAFGILMSIHAHRRV